MAKSFQEMKKEHELSLILKLAILLISVITFFTVFLVLYLTKTANFFFISISVFFLLFGALYIGFSAIIKDSFGYVAGAISLVAGLIVLLAGVIGVVWFVWLISAIVLATVLIVILLSLHDSYILLL